MARKEDDAPKYPKSKILEAAEHRFGLNQHEATAAFFDAPPQMTVKEAEAQVKKFRERTVS